MSRTEPWCHACGIAMTPRTFDAETVWSCRGCLGLFLPDAQERSMDLPTTDVGLRPVMRGAVACPWCDQTMGRAMVDGVEIDRCQACGTWLDSGELERLVQRFDPIQTRAAPPRRRRWGLDVAIWQQRLTGNWAEANLLSAMRDLQDDEDASRAREFAAEASMVEWARRQRPPAA